MGNTRILNQTSPGIGAPASNIWRYFPGGSVASGDLLFMMALFDVAKSPAAPPTGWTLIANQSLGAMRACTWTKTAGASEADQSLNTSDGSAVSSQAVLQVWRSTDGFDTQADQGDASAVSATAPSLTPATTASILVCFFGAWDTSGGNLTTPAGMNPRNTGGDGTRKFWVGDQTLSGVTGTRTSAPSGSPVAGPRFGWSFLLKDNAVPFGSGWSVGSIRIA